MLIEYHQIHRYIFVQSEGGRWVHGHSQWGELLVQYRSDNTHFTSWMSSLINDALIERVNAMEGKLCHCNSESHGSTPEAPSSLLGSPLVLDRWVEEDNASDDLYHMPPLAGSSIPSMPSSIVEDSDQENFPNAGVGYISRLPLSNITDGLLENSEPIPVPMPMLDRAGIDRLVAVHGQHAVRTLGHPKSYHPYPRCCPIGHHSSTHCAGSCCSHKKVVGREPSPTGRVGEQGGSSAF